MNQTIKMEYGAQAVKHNVNAKIRPIDIKASTNSCFDICDVAAAIERVRRTRDASLKDVVNDALRRSSTI
jgi:hypothetical protein